MVPGLALFYGGLVAEKSVIAMMAQSFAAIGIIGILWAAVGYSLAFGTDHWGVIGGFRHVLLRGVGSSPVRSTTACTFAGYLVFIGLWSLVVCCPFAHWMWGGGFLDPDGLRAVD